MRRMIRGLLIAVMAIAFMAALTAGCFFDSEDMTIPMISFVAGISVAYVAAKGVELMEEHGDD